VFFIKRNAKSVGMRKQLADGLQEHHVDRDVVQLMQSRRKQSAIIAQAMAIKAIGGSTQYCTRAVVNSLSVRHSENTFSELC
jgi:hypothetical protein